MKKFYLQICFLAFLLFSHVTTFATDASGEIEDTPEDDAPIDNGLLWLALAGVAFGLYYYSTQRKKRIAN